MKRMLTLVALVIAILFSISFVSLALAAEIRTGAGAQVAAGEVIDDDLYISGTTVNIAGTVNGDAVATAGSINVTGRINGNLFAFAQTVSVSGKVDGGLFAAGQTVILTGEMTRTVRVAGQSILVQGPIGRDLMAAGQAVTLESGSTVRQDLLLAAQEGQVLGAVGRRLQGSVGTLVVGGRVGDVNVQAEQLSMLPGASVGSLTYTSEQEAQIQSGATVSGPINHLLPERRAERRAPSWTDQILPRLWWFVSTLIVGLVAAWLVPSLLREPAEALRDRPWQSLGWGALLFIVTPIAVIVAMITLVGIPIGLLVLFAYGAALFLSQIFVALILGQLILQQRPGEGTIPLLGPLALGLVVVMVAFAVLGLVPFLGGLVVLSTLVLGLGSVWMAAGRARLGQRRPPEPA